MVGPNQTLGIFSPRFIFTPIAIYRAVSNKNVHFKVFYFFWYPFSILDHLTKG